MRREIVFDTAAEAEIAEIFDSEFLWDGADAALLMAGSPTREMEEEDWFIQAWQRSLFFPIERCCDLGRLLPRELREARLAIFPLQLQVGCETHLRRIQKFDYGDEAIATIYWLLRIDRAKRTGSPEFDEKRSTTAWIEVLDDDRYE